MLLKILRHKIVAIIHETNWTAPLTVDSIHLCLNYLPEKRGALHFRLGF